MKQPVHSKASGLLHDAAAEFENSFVPGSNRRKTPASAGGSLAAFSNEYQEISDENQRLKSSAGTAREIPLDLIDDSPFQTRKITQEQIEELALNLAHNPLSTPVVVRKVGERFELVAGHRRVAAYKHLGRSKIAAAIQELNDTDASTALFMDNMYSADLPDYEKYLGLIAYQKAHPEASSQRALAEKTGFSKTQILRLLSFAKLPKKASNYVDQNRRVIGSNVMDALSQLPTISDAALLDALKLISSGNIKQTDLVKYLSQTESTKPGSIEKPEVIVIKRGKDVFAKVLRSKKKVTIDVIDEETAAWIETTIREALEKKANA